MIHILDTCVISEQFRQAADLKVLDWMAAVDESELYLTSFTVGELKKGIEMLADSSQKRTLQHWFYELLSRFRNRILTFDEAAALQWGALTAAASKSGRPLPAVNSMIAAVALSRNAVLVTRNTSDFKETGVELYNPWKTADDESREV